MKFALESVPLWDALREGSECPFCLLMKAAEKDAVAFFSSSAVMESEVRKETNRVGFCPNHSILLSDNGSPQAVALVADTYLDENEKALAKPFAEISSASSVRSVQKAVSSLKDAAGKREKGCLICSKMKDRLDRYAFTLAYLWKGDPDFRTSFLSSKGLCLHHSFLVAERAKDTLKGDDLAYFLKDLFSLLEENLKRVRKEDWEMTQKYKSENRDKPWNGCEDAQKRAFRKLVGEGRIIDPA